MVAYHEREIFDQLKVVFLDSYHETIIATLCKLAQISRCLVDEVLDHFLFTLPASYVEQVLSQWTACELLTVHLGLVQKVFDTLDVSAVCSHVEHRLPCLVEDTKVSPMLCKQLDDD